MAWNKYGICAAVCTLALLLFTACKVSYKFTGTSIDYNVIKTIQIDNIANRAPYGWAPMEAIFNNKLQDLYANQTRLEFVKRNGDLHISGEITGYDQYNKAVSADGYSSQVQLKMTVNVRFTNNTNHDEDFERSFSAVRDFEASQSLESVQEELVTQMIKEIVESIFNAAVANW